MEKSKANPSAPLAQASSNDQPFDAADLDLIALLDAPEVRLIMDVDHVDRAELLAMLKRVRAELQDKQGATPEGSTDGRDPERYRPGVGMVLLNTFGAVFVGERADLAHEVWQMPQGGIDEGETPRQAVMRELKEEIGTNDVDIVAESEAWLYYDVPEELARRAWRGRWIGQRQKWFLGILKADESAINVSTAHPEFRRWRWVRPDALAEHIAPFKRELYEKVLGQFATHFRD
jgi:putative (di)nucleoside polyphosphate hydrolase